MHVLPFHKNSYNVNQIIFLNYGPYEYEYFSKCSFYVVTHVSHTNQIVYINSYSTHPHQDIIISLFTQHHKAPHIRAEVYAQTVQTQTW